MFRRVVSVLAALTVAVVGIVGISGQFVFADAKEDALQPVDAVVVLGGEHDGRERYGIAVARQIGATHVLLSDPYPENDQLMGQICGSRPWGIEIICRRPVPPTTRGEAVMAHRLGSERGWARIIIVSWRFHLPRARLVFTQCYSDDPERIVLRAVPKSYDYPQAVWLYISFYQYAGLAKTAVYGACD